MELNEKEINEIVENIRKDYFYFSEIPDEIKIKYQHLLKISQITQILNNSNFQLEVNGIDNDFVVMKSNLILVIVAKFQT